ncbi:hypothetical protein [Pseudonocardia humida]|uniref:Uncharacterized protein n=1 Tax=Pseudonocardia humida TaxID=2800819 RepID=A0ABT1A9U3_9PSEU|nr:hypothetical protein [Pseudonocardia humida]MCO1659799.1 hypothetical protein [Pseudonocardia humida]
MTTAAASAATGRASAGPLAGVEPLWSLGLALVVVLLVVGWWWADRVDAATRRRAAALPRGDPAPAPPPPPGDRVLVDPPMVENDPVTTATSGSAVVPLRDWLVHFHPAAGNVWSEVTSEFCGAAMRDPRIAGYFRGADPTALQNHSLAVLITVTGGGVTVDMLRRLRDQHADVRDEHGEPISRADLDRAARILVEVLRSKAVPQATLDQVDVVLARLTDAIAPAR